MDSSRIEAGGEAYDDDKLPKRDFQTTLLAAIATIVEALDPTTHATELAGRILSRHNEVRRNQ